MSARNEKKIGFLWQKSGSITMDVNVDKRGYIPGNGSISLHHSLS